MELKGSLPHCTSDLPPVPILSLIDPVLAPHFPFLKIHLNIILPSTPGSPMWSLSFRFPHQNPIYASPLRHTRYMPRLSHSSRFYHPNIIGWGVQIIKLLIMYFSPLSCSTPYSQTPPACVMKAPPSLKTSRSTLPTTRRHVPDLIAILHPLHSFVWLPLLVSLHSCYYSLYSGLPEGKLFIVITGGSNNELRIRLLIRREWNLKTSERKKIRC